MYKVNRKMPWVLAAALAAAAQTAYASDDDHLKARQLREAGEILPLEEILTRIRPEAQGRIIEAELHRSGQRYWYEIELLDPDGAVHELQVDAGSGEVVARERED